MTSSVADTATRWSARRLDPLAVRLQAVRDLTGRPSLLESCDGEIVAHCLGAKVDPAVAAAVLSRSSRPLREAASRGRRVALAGAGPVQALALQNQVATVVPVPSGNGVGHLWLLGEDIAVVDARLQLVIAELGGLATRLAQLEDVDVTAVLDGRADVPTALCGSVVHLLAADADLPGGRAVEELRTAARTSSAQIVMLTGVHLNTDVALLTGPAHLSARQIAELLAPWALGRGIRSVLLPWRPEAPGAAFDEARNALRVASPGCAVSAELRSRVFLQALSDVAAQMPEVSDDPVAALLAHPGEFASALLAWLDCQGDMGRAAELQGCHKNTLRYRVRRASELLQADLADPAFRLEVHLRLVQALRGSWALTSKRACRA